MVSLLITHEHVHDDDDRRSTSTVASTVATTASLASRIASLAIDFQEKFQPDLNDAYEQSILEGNESSYSDRSSEGYEDPEGGSNGCDGDGPSGADFGDGTDAGHPNSGGTSIPAHVHRRGRRGRHHGRSPGASSLASANGSVVGGAGGVGGGGGGSVGTGGGTLQQHLLARRMNGAESPDAKKPLPFSVCSRLFIHKGNHPIQLKRMTINQVEEFKQHGYVVIDDFIPASLAAHIKNHTTAMFSKGRLLPGGKAAAVLSSLAAASGGGATAPPPDSLTPVARGDHVLWLSVGRSPADTTHFSQLLVAFQELQDDVHEFVRLRRANAEYQVSYHAAGSLGVRRHRDAAPDNGREEGVRRITCLCCCTSAADQQQQQQLQHHSLGGDSPTSSSSFAAGGSTVSGQAAQQQQQQQPSAVSTSGGTGGLRVWPPRRNAAPSVGPRRSLAGSDGGTSFSEFSDNGSMRSVHPCTAASISSSMFPEASAHEPDVASIDGSQADGGEGGCSTRGLGLEWVEVDGEMALDVAPLWGRLVMFFSGAVDHAVLPAAHHDMAIVTTWLQ